MAVVAADVIFFEMFLKKAMNVTHKAKNNHPGFILKFKTIMSVLFHRTGGSRISRGSFNPKGGGTNLFFGQFFEKTA